MSIAEKLNTIAENEQKVYEAGAKSEFDKFWDGLQNYGNRKNYDKGFQYWGAEYIKPKYKVVPTGQASYMFADNPNLKAILAEDFDLSSVAQATAWNNGVYGLCNGCSSLEYVEDINIQPNKYFGYMFANCKKLKEIRIVRANENTSFDGTFYECRDLEEVWFEGVIADKSRLTLHFSSKLKKECVLDMFEHLKDFSETGETAKVGLHPNVISNLADAEKAIATQKGWTIYSV